MKNFDGIEVMKRNGKKPSEGLKRQFAILYDIFSTCVHGEGLVDEALDAAKLLVNFLDKHQIVKNGDSIPDWHSEIVDLYLRKGMIKEAIEAAKIRGKPLTNKELEMIQKTLADKKDFRKECYNLAGWFAQEGMLEQAAAAARLAGKDLGSDNLILVNQAMVRRSHERSRG